VTETTARPRRLTAVLREEERVTPLELFFDLVFVLAITQCTALMAADPTWAGLAKGLVVLAVLWWSWGGYAWLTSVVDPEEGAVRIAMFGAMAAFLVAALCVPEAFDDSALMFASAYGVVRIAHIALFLIASRDDPRLRKSVVGLAGSTALGVGLLFTAALADGWVQGGIWALALLLDLGGPFLFGVEGWKLVPGRGAVRRDRPLPARPRRGPAAGRAHAQQAAPPHGGAAGRADPGRGRAAGARIGRARGGRPVRADRVRGDPLRGGTRPDPPPARARGRRRLTWAAHGAQD
jgi:hypothetical protein